METPKDVSRTGLGLGVHLTSKLSDDPENVLEPSQAAEHLHGLHEKSPLNTTRAELRLLETSHTEMTAMATPLQFAWNAVFQTVCVAIAFLFGVFAIFSWRGQKVGNNLSLHANQLAIITICLTSNSTDIADTCGNILPKLSASFAKLAADSFGEASLEGGAVWPWRAAYDQNLRDPTGLIIMIVVPVVCAGLGLYASTRIYAERFSR